MLREIDHSFLGRKLEVVWHVLSSSPNERCVVNLCDPTISSYNGASMGGDSWPKLRAFFSNWSSDGRSLHLTLWVDDNGGVVYTAKRGQKLNKECLPSKYRK